MLPYPTLSQRSSRVDCNPDNNPTLDLPITLGGQYSDYNPPLTTPLTLTLGHQYHNYNPPLTTPLTLTLGHQYYNRNSPSVHL